MRLILGEALATLRTLPDASFDVVLTDPPYSSGALHATGRKASTGKKYQHGGTKITYPDFGGDARDQRSFLAWCTLWISECKRLLKPGGYFLAFSDWRQLPTLTDALQAGDIIWRGIIPWDKGLGARAPHTGFFRHQCEYVAWGTSGAIRKAPGRGPYPGCFKAIVRPGEKRHQTGKPVELLRPLLACVPPGGKVLDPFAGSGSTLVASYLEGLDATGIEREPVYHAIGSQWLAEVTGQTIAA